MSKGSKIFSTLQKKKIQKLKNKEHRLITRNENLSNYSDKMVKFGILFYLIIYLVLIILNKVLIDLSEYYLLILSSYFILFSIIYMKKKKLNASNLLISKIPLKKDKGVFFGILIFFYYIITANFFSTIFSSTTYSFNTLLLIISILITSISCEIFFRGIIQRSLKIKNNKNKSIAIQALLWSILGMDFFNMSFSTIHIALFTALIIYPVGLLLGYIKEEWYLDSSISASLTFGLLSIIVIFL